MCLGISIIVVLVAVIIFSAALSQSSYAQTNEQYAITGKELANDPIAQDILKKIEKTKRWVEQIEKRSSDHAKIEEKKKVVLTILESKILELEQKWEQHTFEYRLEQMKEKTSHEYVQNNWQNSTMGMNTYQRIINSGGTPEKAEQTAIQTVMKIHNIFADNLNYTYSKIKEGQAAMKFVLDKGGTGMEAQAAYAQAAQMKISDLVAINSLNNVKYDMAYYNQQILFEANGQFNDLKSGEALQAYYQDYRVNPGYIFANPKDTSWRNIGQVSATSLDCRVEHVLVYRYNSEDYVCTSTATAEMWQKYGMANVTQNTPNPYDLSIAQLHEDRVDSKVENAQRKLQTIDTSHLGKIKDLDKKYENMYAKMEAEKKSEERRISDEAQLLDIRDRYQTLADLMAQDKEQFIKIVQRSQNESYQELVKVYEDDKDVKLIWNLDEAYYKVVRR